MNPKVILMGGFGNQLFQIAFALSRFKSGKIEVESWFANARMNQNGHAEIWSYRLPERLEPLRIAKSRLLGKALNFALRLNLRASEKLLNRLLSTSVKFFAELIVSVHLRSKQRLVLADNVGFGSLTYSRASNRDLVMGYFQSAAWISPEVLTELRNLEPRDRLSELEDYRKLALIEHPIVVHVRLGDYENEPGIGLLPFDYYLNGLNYLTEKMPESKIWLFSNDLEKAKRMFSSWNGIQISFIEDNWNSTSMTFELMRMGHAYLIANSTFSYWAALLSRTTSPTIIAPTPWFLNSTSPQGILPETWVAVNVN